jgi:succinate-semialdehyde dehydrogenase/glutarate-semialdehyde dehydrogenase
MMRCRGVFNDTEFGLATYFYSDIGRIWRIAEELEYGIEEFLEVKYLCMGGINGSALY